MTTQTQSTARGILGGTPARVTTKTASKSQLDHLANNGVKLWDDETAYVFPCGWYVTYRHDYKYCVIIGNTEKYFASMSHAEAELAKQFKTN